MDNFIYQQIKITIQIIASELKFNNNIKAKTYRKILG